MCSGLPPLIYLILSYWGVTICLGSITMVSSNFHYCFIYCFSTSFHDCKHRIWIITPIIHSTHFYIPLSIRIESIHRIIVAEGVWADAVVLLRKGIHAEPAGLGWGIVACAVVQCRHSELSFLVLLAVEPVSVGDRS